MLKKSLILFLFVMLFVLTGCIQENSEIQKEDSLADVKISDVADVDLQTVAEDLSQRYSEKPKNQSVSSYENLSKKELQKLVGAGVDLSGLHEISARKIGEDYFYILVETIDANLEQFRIYKNNEQVFEFKSEPLSTYSPIVSVRIIENKYTVEYVEKMYSLSLNKFLEKQRIWQDGNGEITQKFALNSAIMPFEANGKMIFLGEKEGKWKMFFGDEVLVEEFERIDFGYCCEPALYMPRAFNYRYLVFFATQDARQKLVEVDFGGND